MQKQSKTKTDRKKNISRQMVKKKKMNNSAKAFALDEGKKETKKKNPESMSEKQNKKERIRERGRVTLTSRGRGEKALSTPSNARTRLKERGKRGESCLGIAPRREEEGKVGV